MEYSTFGGTDGYSLRLISPSDTKDFKEVMLKTELPLCENNEMELL